MFNVYVDDSNTRGNLACESFTDQRQAEDYAGYLFVNGWDVWTDLPGY